MIVVPVAGMASLYLECEHLPVNGRAGASSYSTQLAIATSCLGKNPRQPVDVCVVLHCRLTQSSLSLGKATVSIDLVTNQVMLADGCVTVGPRLLLWCC